VSEHALIVGATSGIARALAAELAGRGWSLTLAARDDAEVAVIASDLRIRFDIPVAVAHLNVDMHTDFDQFFAGKDCTAVIVCHGVYIPQEAAQEDAEAHQRMIESNYTGTVLLLEAAARFLQPTGKGRIAALSSIAGDRGRADNYCYGATKAALTAYLSGLRARLARAGVHVMTVKPGPTDTAMTRGLITRGRAADVRRVAADIAKGIARRKDVVYTPWPWWWVMAVIRLLPEFVFKRIKFSK